uniref:BED-type domain-containing protein n=1 Tax=Crocodylus porosus TaxID=8502 RepID=A0A7M4FBM7_CROPO
GCCHSASMTYTSLKYPSHFPAPGGSVVWDHFEVTDDPRYATCQHCQRKISRGKEVKHFATTAMLLHLKRKHPLALVPPQPGTSGSVPKKKSPSCSKAPVPKKHRLATLERWGKGGHAEGRVPKASELTQTIGEMLALDGQPFSFVERPGFRQLMALMAPSYQVPTCTTFSRTVVPSLYEACREYLREELRKAGPQVVLHFTSDIWSSRGGDHAYLSLTGHWCDQSGRRWALLQAEVLDESHTARDIMEAMNHMVQGWLVGQGELTRGFMVTDNGANMVKAVCDANFVGICCVAHRFHLIVRDALEGDRAAGGSASTTSKLISKCRKLAGYFHQSIKGGKMLQEKQAELSIPQHKIMLDVETRWSSTYLMLERLVEQQKAIHEMALLEELGISGPLHKMEWDTISQILVVLKPFLEATESLSAGDALLSQVIPVVKELENRMEKFQGIDAPGWGRPLSPDVQALVRRMKEGIRRWLDPLRSSTVHVLAAMCDPRVKGSVCSSQTLDHWTEVLVNRVREAEGQRQGDVDEGDPLSRASTPATSQPPPPQPLPMWAKGVASMLGSRGTRPHHQAGSAEASVTIYLDEDVEPLDCDPLAYWATRSQMWPDLATVAREHLSCPPASVPSERVFSIAGDVVTPHRTCLDPGLVEQLARLHLLILPCLLICTALQKLPYKLLVIPLAPFFFVSVFFYSARDASFFALSFGK